MDKEFHKYLLRIPNSLKEELSKNAKREQRSLGNYIINILSLHIENINNVENKK